jgi:hypothetical protein
MPTAVPAHFFHIIRETCRRQRKRVPVLLHTNILLEELGSLIPSVYVGKCGREIEDHMGTSSSIMANLTVMTSREFNAVVLNILGGAYDSAARTLRWMLETSVKAFVAISDKSILTGSKGDEGKSMTFDEFTDFLEWNDLETSKHEKSCLSNKSDDSSLLKRAKRWKVIRGIDRLPDKVNLPWLCGLQNAGCKYADVIYCAYRQLSSYVHTNLRDFRLSSLESHPFVTYERKEFEKIYKLAVVTCDIVAYLFILGIWIDISYFSDETGIKFFEVLRKGLGTEKLSFFLKELPSVKRLIILDRGITTIDS